MCIVRLPAPRKHDLRDRGNSCCRRPNAVSIWHDRVGPRLAFYPPLFARSTPPLPRYGAAPLDLGDLGSHMSTVGDVERSTWPSFPTLNEWSTPSVPK